MKPSVERCRSGRTGRSRKQTFIAPSQASSLKTFAERIENVSGIRKTAFGPPAPEPKSQADCAFSMPWPPTFRRTPHEQGKNLRNIGAASAVKWPADMKRLLVSFSAGESSALMVKLIAENPPPDCVVVFVFANTGQEHPLTLVFANAVDFAFALHLVWVESVVRHNQRKSCGHRIVDFETACRDGSLFEAMVQKYGIANKAYPHCTRSLKLDPITSYARSIGWEHGSYYTAIGLRSDEVDRMSTKADANKILYPLISMWPHKKRDVNAFWRDQPFRLEITGYQGNCVWCWKKTLRKHLTLIEDDASWYDLPARLEAEYPTSGHNIDGTPRTFFREGRSAQDLIAEARQPFERFDDENRQYDTKMDVGEGCGESCEVFADG